MFQNLEHERNTGLERWWTLCTTYMVPGVVSIYYLLFANRLPL